MGLAIIYSLFHICFHPIFTNLSNWTKTFIFNCTELLGHRSPPPAGAGTGLCLKIKMSSFHIPVSIELELESFPAKNSSKVPGGLKMFLSCHAEHYSSHSTQERWQIFLKYKSKLLFEACVPTLEEKIFWFVQKMFSSFQALGGNILWFVEKIWPRKQAGAFQAVVNH